MLVSYLLCRTHNKITEFGASLIAPAAIWRAFTSHSDQSDSTVWQFLCDAVRHFLKASWKAPYHKGILLTITVRAA